MKGEVGNADLQGVQLIPIKGNRSACMEQVVAEELQFSLIEGEGRSGNGAKVFSSSLVWETRRRWQCRGTARRR